LGPLIKSQPPAKRKPQGHKGLRTTTAAISAPFQRADEQPPPVAEMPPDLAQVAAALRHLPEAVRASILATVTAPRGQ